MSVRDYSLDRPGAERPVWAGAGAEPSRWRYLDWVLIGAALSLSLAGILLVYSATRGRTDLHEGQPYAFVLRHVLNLVLGLLLSAAVVWLGNGRVRDVAPLLYGVSVLLTALLLTPLGSTVNGSQRWIELGGGFAFQPSELVKVGLILVVAALISTSVEATDRAGPDVRTVLVALALAGVPALLVVLTPDLGQTMMIVTITFGVLLASGASRGWIAGLLGAGAGGALLAWQLGLFDEYQINRFAAFANPALEPAGAGYNTSQARIAIGSGQLFGSGLFQGGQTTGQFVPEQHTDFVFTVAGEELGFVGAGLLIVLIGVVLFRGLRIARESADLYGTLVAAGIVVWLAFQSFENIGMALGIMPVTGLPLPFISYGGSSMFAVWIAVGLLLAVRERSRRRL